MTRSNRRRSSPWRIGLLVVVILGLLYFNQFVVTTMPTPFTPTTTPTRSVESFLNEAQILYAEGKLTQAISGLHMPAIGLTCKQEAILDLFNEQAFGPAFGRVLLNAIQVLLERSREEARARRWLQQLQIWAVPES